jgi:hypothetical protein
MAEPQLEQKRAPTGNRAPQRVQKTAIVDPSSQLIIRSRNAPGSAMQAEQI